MRFVVTLDVHINPTTSIIYPGGDQYRHKTKVLRLFHAAQRSEKSCKHFKNCNLIVTISSEFYKYYVKGKQKATQLLQINLEAQKTY